MPSYTELEGEFIGWVNAISAKRLQLYRPARQFLYSSLNGLCIHKCDQKQKMDAHIQVDVTTISCSEVPKFKFRTKDFGIVREQCSNCVPKFSQDLS